MAANMHRAPDVFVSELASSATRSGGAQDDSSSSAAPSSHKRRRAAEGESGDVHMSDTAPLGALSIRMPAALAHAPSSLESVGRFEDSYSMGDVLGHGTFSVVRRCTHTATGEVRAVKIIDTRKFKLSSTARTHESKILDEVRILRSLSTHPGVLHLLDVYDQTWEGHSAMLLVSELAPGGELFDSIIKAGNFTEPQARHVMWQALQAVQYMHSQGVIHRDLKPENLLVFSATHVPSADPVVRPGMPVVSCTMPPPAGAATTPMLNIKIGDFGVARHVGAAAHASGATTFVGSPQYVAPEVLFTREHRHGVSHGGPTSYGKAVDVYSLGVIAFVCVAGYLPFDDAAPRPADAPVIMGADGAPESWDDRAKAGRFYFAPPVWTHISDAAKDLIRHMMAPNPNDRFSTEQALAHAWFEPVRRALDPAPAFPIMRPFPAAGTPPVPDFARLSITGAPPTWQQHQLSSGTLMPLPVNTSSVGPSVVQALHGPQHILQPPMIASTMLESAFSVPAHLLGSSNVPTRLSPSASRVSAQRLLLNGMQYADVPQAPVPAAGGATVSSVADAGGSPTATAAWMHSADVLATVSRSLDFQSLIQLQQSIASTFATAYDAVRDIPEAALVIRRHAVACRELQARVGQVIQRCRTLAISILLILPDLKESVTTGEADLTRGIFERIRSWVRELKEEAQSMQSAYNAIIRDVQTSIETARTLQVDAHNHDRRAARPDSTEPENVMMRPHPAVQAIPDTDSDAGSTIPTPSAPMSSSRSVSQPQHVHGLASTATPSPHASAGSRGGPPADARARVASPDGSVEHKASSPSLHSATSAAMSADDVLELFLGTPTVLANDRRMKRMMSGLGIEVPSGHAHALQASPLGGLPPGSHAHAALGGMSAPPSPPRLPTPGVTRVGSDVELPDALPTPTAHDMQVVRYASGLHIGVHNHLQDGGSGGHSNSSHAVTSTDGHAGSHKCLGCALAELRALDTILCRAVSFWTSLETVVDVVVRRKEHSEVLLQHSSSARMLAKATQSLRDYEDFWNAFAILCNDYASHSVEWMRGMYSWLNAPDAGSVPMLAGQAPAEAPVRRGDGGGAVPVAR